MTFIPGYQTVMQIYKSPSSLVFRATRTEDGLPVILKVLREDYPKPHDIIRYKQEYHITLALQRLPGVIGVYGIEKHRKTLVMILEDFGGESLKILQGSRHFSITECLSIAIRTTEILGHIHSANVIHKDINPGNIVFNPATGQLKVIDFGIASLMSREEPAIKTPDALEGTLAYLAPEQTGRMNRSIDYRSDYYSLGATLYELLTGTRPFSSDDALELVHCHIARAPTPPHDLRHEIPEPVSGIVLKLLSKNAEDRYQSARGIRLDLEECLASLDAYGRIDPFPLGRQDIPEKFRVSQKLYGRESQIETFMEAFDRAGAGNREMMLVSGGPGIGKTSLVNEIHKPVTRQRGYFVSGKFDQFHRNNPFTGFVAAFKELIRVVLAEDESRLSRWRERILDAVGPNGQVISGVIPEVELIIGPQPAVEEVGPIESRNRFYIVFRNFIRVFCSAEHPLVVFLDDVQWADAASLRLMELIITDDEMRFLFLIAAYRDNEVSPTHPFMVTLESLREQAAPITQIELRGLDLAHVIQLAADTLHRDPQDVRPLAELISGRTAGNPFFVNEFLKSLYVEQLLRFDSQAGAWQWDLNRIQECCVTDNVVALMAENIKRCKRETQETLKLAACIGNQFDLNTLAIACEKTAKETLAAMSEAVVEGLVFPLGEAWKSIELEVDLPPGNQVVEYKFSHDRIQQAAYSLIPEAEQQSVHFQIGRLMLRHLPSESLEDHVFDIANHLNAAIPLLESQSERHELARLNLVAGRRARASAAYEAAFRYLKSGVNALGNETWHDQYDLTLALHVEAAEAAYLSTDFDTMEQLSRQVLEHGRTLLDKTQAYEVKIQAYIAQNRTIEAIGLAIEILKLMGTHIPARPTKLAILARFLKTRHALKTRSIEELLELPLMTDPLQLATMRVLSSVAKAAYVAVPELTPVIIFKSADLSVAHGNAPESAFAYSAYGFFLCAIMGKMDEGYRFGQLALKVAARLHEGKSQARTLMVVNLLITHWTRHFKEVLKPIVEGYHRGIEMGNLEDAAVCAFIYCSASYHLGKELSSLSKELDSYSDAIRKLKQKSSLYLNEVFRQAVANLVDESNEPWRLIGEAFHEETMLPVIQQAGDRSVLSIFHLNKLILCFLFHQYDEGLEHAKMLAKNLDGVMGTVTVPLFSFYDSLTRLAICPSAGPFRRYRLLRRVRASQKKMKYWARFAPMNFLHKYVLVEAERDRVLGRDTRATDGYERAIALAREHGYLHEEALAHELAARFHRDKGRDTIAKAFAQEARYCYMRWGALAKVRAMDREYGDLFLVTSASTVSRMRETRTTVTSTGTPADELLDLAAVVKASQAISGEIVLKPLLDTLMRIVIEIAGAQKGFLIRKANGELVIEAQADQSQDSDGKNQYGPGTHLTDSHDDVMSAGQQASAESPNTVTVLTSLPVEHCRQLSRSVVDYVYRTKESRVLKNAAIEDEFAHDPYVRENKPKSILCMPLIRQGRLSGILYLENNLATAAFTPDRLGILNLVCSQAAISLENARLYEQQEEYARNLEQRVAARTSDLAESESRYRSIFETTGAATVIVEDDTTISLCNSEFQNLTGYSGDEIDGKKKWSDFVGEEDMARLMEYHRLRRIDPDAAPKHYEFCMTDRANTSRDILATVGIIPGTRKSIASLIDITQRKKTEVELRRAHEVAAAEARKLRSLIEGMDHGIVFADADDTITETNTWFLRKVGLGRHEVIGRNMWEFHRNPEMIERLQRLISAYKTGRQIAPLEVSREFSGMHVSFRVQPIFHQGRYRGVILYVVDVSDLEMARERAEQASRVKGEFLTNMSHELRTPLNAIIGFSEILHDRLFGELNEDQLRYVGHVLDSGKHLLGLINNILDLSKVESGKMLLNLALVEVQQLLEDSLIMIREKSMKHGIKLKLHIGEELAGAEVWADELKLKQILFNLLSNAAKFTPDEGEIRVHARINGTDLVVSVSDTGIGIGHHDRKRIFESFEQVDSSPSRRQQGTGLGLALTKQMVELHHGTIWAESEGEGRGSTFTFVIPLCPAES